MRFVVVALLLVASLRAVAAGAGAGDDGAAVQAAVDDAFARLAKDDGAGHAFARQRLARAAAAFDDLALRSDGLRQALVGDATKPWRGRAFERVLSLATLAALDIERGRCDLALPTLRNAALHDARVAAVELHGQSDAVVVAALALRCLADGDASAPPASGADVARARDDLRATLRAAGAADAADIDGAASDLERRVRDGRARLVFTGWAPSFARAGAHGEQLVLTPRDEDDGVAGVVRLGRAAPRGDDGLDGLTSRRGAVCVWSSTTQATAVRGRPFDAVRAARARNKDATAQAGWQTLTRATTTPLSTSPTSTTSTTAGLLGLGLQAAGGAGLLAVSAAIDARADDRFVAALPGKAWIVVPDDG